MYNIGEILICIEEIKINGFDSLANTGDIFTIEEITNITYKGSLKYGLRNNKTKYLSQFGYDTLIKYFEKLFERRKRLIEEIV